MSLDRDDAGAYRLAQANALIRRATVRALDGQWHPAYERQADGSFDLNTAAREVEAALGPEALAARIRVSGATRDGKVIPDQQDYEATGEERAP